jgi:hypothetical protein
MTREMIIERLTWVAKAKPGDMQPPWMGRPGDWASPLSSLAQETLNLIEHYEKVLKDSNETILF